MRKVKRRKPPALRKETVIRIRVTAEQRNALQEAANQMGLDLSSWLRERALASARAEIGEQQSLLPLLRQQK